MLRLIPGATTALALWCYLMDEDAPAGHRLAILLSVLYLATPFDFVPEAALGLLGLADDAAVFMGLLSFVGSSALRPYRTQARRWLRGEIDRLDPPPPR